MDVYMKYWCIKPYLRWKKSYAFNNKKKNLQGTNASPKLSFCIKIFSPKVLPIVKAIRLKKNNFDTH